MAMMDAVEWRDMSGDDIVHRWPETGPGTIKLGSQLTVRESQAAVFFRDGKALDVFGPGRHTLETANLPLLTGLISLPFGGTTPFQAEVYFVNMKIFTDMKWGTPTPIIFRDSELDTVRLRAFGAYTMRVDDPQLFVNGVVGTQSIYESDEARDWLRDFIASRFTDTLGDVMETVLDLPRYYDEIGVAAKARVSEDFERYGMELVDFVVAAITPPDEVAEMIDERARMEAVGDVDRFTKFRTAEAIGDMPNAGDGGGAAATGMGMGAGVGMGAAMAGAIQEAVSSKDSADEASSKADEGGREQAEQSVEGGSSSPAGAKFCVNCGSKLGAGWKFCPECGREVDEQAE